MTRLCLLASVAVALVSADNQCSPADLDIITKRDNFNEFVYGCAVKKLGDGDRTARCVRDGCGISSACADCYGLYTKCGRSCAGKCVIAGRPSDQSCQDCVESMSCGSKLAACIGVSEPPSPPSSRSNQCN
ncbi:hypothetical protein FOZ60_004592 [Perkinsus olseni]|uniref:Immunoglobulin super DCC subclass member n=1 Tax=Perkinsus olseni TaxID=32597 RepID=A0A7J6PHS4_PEROL|nr:hypothetical protein FOZ60_004592 [Perkinsus olseni]